MTEKKQTKLSFIIPLRDKRDEQDETFFLIIHLKETLETDILETESQTKLCSLINNYRAQHYTIKLF